MPLAKQKKGPYVLKDEDSHVVCRINRQTKIGAYFLARRSSQRKFVDRISLVGFTSLPSGFRRDGGGFPSSGWLLLRQLSDKFNNFSLTVHSSDPTSIKLSDSSVILNHDDLSKILRKMRTIKAARFAELSGTVGALLHSVCPSKFAKPKEESDSEYQPNALSNLLTMKNALEKLSKEDAQALGNLLPAFIQKFGALTGKQRLFSLSDSKRATEVVYVQKVIEDFERRLAMRAQNEHSWQMFLRDYILLFNSNYATVIEKANLAVLGTRFPDFLLVDAYSYLDIYEIKKPSTNLLKKDESRGNYYWDVEITKAISQVENYIAHADRNGPSLCDEIRKQNKLDVRLIKPRGFIIAGTRTQLMADELMEDNFRLLNNSLKNLSIILFDELLDNLKNFLRKIGTAPEIPDTPDIGETGDSLDKTAVQ